MVGLSDKEIRMQQDEELVNEIRKALKPLFYFIRTSIKKDLIDRVRDRILQHDVDQFLDVAQVGDVDLEKFLRRGEEDYDL